jgi:hypothetical protein
LPENIIEHGLNQVFFAANEAQDVVVVAPVSHCGFHQETQIGLAEVQHRLALSPKTLKKGQMNKSQTGMVFFEH